jgi:hypothetical protein
LWPSNNVTGEQLVLICHPEAADTNPGFQEELSARNRRLPDFKRVSGFVLWNSDFPRTASMKIKRNVLAEQIRDKMTPPTAVNRL